MRIHHIFFFLAYAFGYVCCISPKYKYTVCDTPACTQTGNLLLDSIDTSVKPCDDIYQYICGKWIKNHPIEDSNQKGFTTLPDVKNVRYERLLDILNEKSKPQDTVGIKLARQLYNKCLDRAKRETDGLTMLNHHIKQIGDWPLLTPKKNLPVGTKWQDIYKKIDLYFSSAGLYNVKITQNGDAYELLLTGPITFLTYIVECTRGKKFGSCKVALYKKLIKNVSRELANSRGLSIHRYRTSQGIKDIINFEIEILKVRNSVYETLGSNMTIEECQNMYNNMDSEGNGKINWLAMIQNKFFQAKLQITPDMKIVVFGCNYFVELNALLKRTPVRTIVNYIVWHFIRNLLPYTTEKMQTFVQQAERGGQLQQEDENRLQETCIEVSTLVHAVNYEYLKRHFNEDSKENVLQILREVITAAQENVEQTTWMNSTTKASFKEDVDSKVLHVGYPDWYNDENIRRYYTNVDKYAFDLTFLDSVLYILKYDALPNNKLGLHVSPNERHFFQRQYSTNFTIPSAYEKSLRIPAGVFHDILYHPDKPESMNYGAVGYKLGYQLATGYGALYGLFKQELNMTKTLGPREVHAYSRMENCFHTYYNAHIKLGAKGRFSQTDAHVPFQRFLADVAVITTLSRAWRKHELSFMPHSKEVRLHLLPHHSRDQLFFMSIIYNNCENKPYSNKHVRLSSSLANLPIFSQIFRCPKQSPMNPAEKCNIWS